MNKTRNFGNKTKRYLSRVPIKKNCLKNFNFKKSETPKNNYDQVNYYY